MTIHFTTNNGTLGSFSSRIPTSLVLLHTTYTCAFKPGCRMSHNWLHTPDCKVLNEYSNAHVWMQTFDCCCRIVLPRYRPGFPDHKFTAVISFELGLMACVRPTSRLPTEETACKQYNEQLIAGFIAVC